MAIDCRDKMSVEVLSDNISPRLFHKPKNVKMKMKIIEAAPIQVAAIVQLLHS